MHKRYLALAAAVTLLAACSTAPRTYDTVRVVNSSLYPDLPDLPKLPPLDLQPFKYDMPRDKNGQILTDSNVFIGFDEKNWRVLLENFKKLEAREQMHQAREDAVNQQRAEWRRLNAEAAQPKP